MMFFFFEDAPDAATLTTVPRNTTLIRDSIMSLNCQTNASPKADYHFYFNGKYIGNSTSGVFSVAVVADGVYTCVPVNTVGTGNNATVSISVVGKLTSMCYSFFYKGFRNHLDFYFLDILISM